MASPSPHTLRVITGALSRSTLIGRTRVSVAPFTARVPELDVVVVEEDTWLVLSTSPELEAPVESMDRVMGELQRFEPPQPGTVRVRRGQPLELVAIVHDLEQTPSWREEWIATALERVLNITRRKRLKRLAMPLLGSVHGRFPPERFVALLRQWLEREFPEHPEHLWLVTETARVRQVSALLGITQDDDG